MKLGYTLLVLLVGIFLEKSVVFGLKFARQDSITIDNPNGVIEVGRQTKFTCNYMKHRTETILSIGWIVSYENSNTNYGKKVRAHFII